MVGMLQGALAVVVILGLLLLTEKLRNSKHLKAEITRKIIHISVGSFVATWPFFMPNWVIYAICAAFISIVLISRIGGLFPSIHGVERKTWGDVLFPIGIAFTLFIAHDQWIFAASLLHLSIADGVAALVGEKFGQFNAYKILGYKKTLAGNLAFLAISFGVVYGLTIIPDTGFSHLGALSLLWVPVIATFSEAFSVRGSDNIVVPIAVALMLNSLQVIG